jgi:metal-responsive CopG/Arc/MetJ family transcriptional regulator
MTTVSVRLPDPLLKAADNGAKLMRIPRSEYFRLAIEEMNKRLQEQGRRQRLMQASQRVRAEAMAVNAEFETIEHDVDA